MQSNKNQESNTNTTLNEAQGTHKHNTKSANVMKSILQRPKFYQPVPK
jgi:hypothetical protein